MDEVYGPPLPPGYQRSHSSSSPSSLSSSNNKNDCIIEATIPSNANEYISDSSSSRTSDTPFIGPTLPPGFKQDETENDESKNRDKKIIGPILLPGFKSTSDSDSSNSDSSNSDSSNSDSSNSDSSNSDSSDSDSDSNSIIGPQPYSGHEISQSHQVACEINSRAKKMKDKLLRKNEDDKAKREVWMLELPASGKRFGFKARKFSLNPAPLSAGCSGWTDTPSDKACKEKEGQCSSKESNEPTAAEVFDAKKNEKLTDVIDSFNKTNRTESLLEIHQKSRKRKAEEENKPEERREFDRETDLLINSLDEDKKKQIIERSQELNSRFSHGQSSHFL